MADIPNTRFFNFVDTPASIKYNQAGEAQVPLDPKTGGIIDVSGFRRASILIGSTTASLFIVSIGKISGTSLAQGYGQPIDNKIHTFEVVGPQMNLLLKGVSPNLTEQVQLWVYLSS